MLLALLCALNLGLQVNRRALDIESDGYFALRRVQACESLNVRPDVLFLGSSRVVYGVNPEAVDAALADRLGRPTTSCNVATFGSTFEQDYYTLKRMIEDGVTPKMVVEDLREYNFNTKAQAPADTSDLALAQIQALADLPDTWNMWRAQRLGTGVKGVYKAADLALSQTVALYGDRLGAYRILCASSTFGPCAGVADLPGAGNVAIQRYLQANRKGWVALSSHSIADLTPAQMAAAPAAECVYLSPELQNFTIGGNQPVYLARLIALAQSHHVRVSLVVSPLHRFLYNCFSRRTDWDAIVSYERSFGAMHGVTYFDSSHAAGYTDADWYDAEHLSAAGAAKYAQWLATTVVAPLLDAQGWRIVDRSDVRGY